jgi:hypothetical protein
MTAENLQVVPAPGPSPRADRAAMRAFRPSRTVPATLTAAVLTLLGALVTIEVVSALLGAPARLVPYDGLLAWATTTQWADGVVILGAAVLVALGLLLLLLALVPGRPRLVPLRTGDPDLIIGMRRRDFARTLEHAAREVPGVDGARIGLLRRRADVVAYTSLRDRSGLADAVRQAVADRVAALDPVGGRRVEVRLRVRDRS